MSLAELLLQQPFLSLWLFGPSALLAGIALLEYRRLSAITAPWLRDYAQVESRMFVVVSIVIAFVMQTLIVFWK